MIVVYIYKYDFTYIYIMSVTSDIFISHHDTDPCVYISY